MSRYRSKSREGYIVVETSVSGCRYWFWDSNVDAQGFISARRTAYAQAQAADVGEESIAVADLRPAPYYTIRRADVAELQ